MSTSRRAAASGKTSTGRTSTGTPPATPSNKGRRAPLPGRRALVGAVLLVLVGSFLPWLDTAAGTLSGAGGPGIWTFYAATLGLAGVLVPLRRLAIAQAALLAVVAIALPVWQLFHVWNLVGFGGWMPGPGLVLVLGGGVVAANAARKMVAHR